MAIQKKRTSFSLSSVPAPSALGLLAILVVAGFVFDRTTPLSATTTRGLSQPPADSARTVKAYGAVGDGKADDTLAIQKAVTTERDVALPAGKYRITDTITLDLEKLGYRSIVGTGTVEIINEADGPAFEFIGTHGGTASPKTVKENIWSRQRMPIVRGIGIRGASPKSIGIRARGTMQLSIQHLHIRNCLHAIHLVERNRNVLISDCHFYENRGVGVFLDNVNLHQINVSNCHVSYNEQGGIVVKDGNVRNLQVGNCDIEGNMKSAGPTSANIMLDCSNGSVAEIAISGCTIQHANDSPESANIRMLGAGEEGRKYGNITISNNVLSDVQVNIDLDGVRGAAITGNTIWKGVRHAIRIRNSRNVVIGSNIIDRNPLYQESIRPHNNVVIEASEFVNITGLQLAGTRHCSAGMIISQCRALNISGCTIADCENASIVLDGVQDSLLTNCLISPHSAESKSILTKDCLELTVAANKLLKRRSVGRK